MIPARGKPESGHSCLRIGSVTGLLESQKVTESRERAKVTILAILADSVTSAGLPQPAFNQPGIGQDGPGKPRRRRKRRLFRVARFLQECQKVTKVVIPDKKVRV